MRRRIWPWLRAVTGAAIVAVLVWRLGTGRFLHGLAMIDLRGVLAALAIGLATTVLSAWRWCLVARGLGLRLGLRGAVADYYRSQFLNAVLPAGVLGDVHRAVRHGRREGDVRRGVGAVVLERFAGQIALALDNLVANAVKYSEDGATVEVAAAGGQDVVEVSVRDRGIGIPAGEIDRIFERFYRVDRARPRATGGTGLGLSIVKHVAASHGGRVTVTSREGEGSTFTITLPRGPVGAVAS